jgi:hypothetical protein
MIGGIHAMGIDEDINVDENHQGHPCVR